MTALRSDRLAAAMASIGDRLGPPPEIALILGSGLGGLADAVEGAVAIPYDQIEGFPVSTAPGHAGRLVAGMLFGRRVVLMQGRVHLYEGWQPADIALSVRLLARLGARSLVVTNAAGALDPEFAPGDVMLIEDHLNLTGVNPLTGPNDDSIGLRFPDMSRAYDLELRTLARREADALGMTLRHGIYIGIAGPSLETSAERRFLRAAGGDAVGMSTVLEVIAAVHCGLRVLGLSAITNDAGGGPDQKPDTIEDVLAHAGAAGVSIATLLARVVPAL
jgi:purine-nucleoside phosphorylase